MKNNKKKGDVRPARRLVDRLVSPPADGSLIAILATTYELQAEFLETDFLPSLLGLGAWDDRNWTSRIAIEKSLADTESAAVFMDTACYRGRPRSLRLSIHPVAVGRGQILHAKVTLLVYDRAVRLIVGSANLTEPGYRKNREVAATLRATPEDQRHVPMLRQAIAGMRVHLADRWNEAAERAASLAVIRLSEWGDAAPSEQDSWFAWSGRDDTMPLLRQMVERWPEDDRVHTITIVSPFWSEERGDGPLAQLIDVLRAHGSLASGARLRLLADARPVGDNKFLPILPESYRTWNATGAGVIATAAAVDPSVLPEEVDGVEEFRGTRRLHAKVALLEGNAYSLAYFGSANFTQHGWGFRDGLPANLEAGIILRARGADRAALAGLIPGVTGPDIPLDGAAGDQLAVPSQIETPAPWPAFIREITLVAADELHLALEITVFAAEVEGPWSLTLASDETRVLATGHQHSPVTTKIDLAYEVLASVLVDQEVCVRWWEHPQGTRHPVNVELAARDGLPIAPGSQHPKEHLLLLYYQGRIAWEELYPEHKADADGVGGSPVAVQATVDTSRIQAYQVREFVEALRGMRDDLKAASSSPGTMRLAVLGPVSPVALARHVEDAVRRSERSPTAGAFQLVELLGCLDEASRSPVERDQAAWNSLLLQARAVVTTLLGRIQSEHPVLFPSGGLFRKYQASLDQFHRPEGT